MENPIHLDDIKTTDCHLVDTLKYSKDSDKVCYCGTTFYNFLTSERYDLGMDTILAELFGDGSSLFCMCLNQQVLNLKVTEWKSLELGTSSRRIDYSVLIKRQLFSKHKMAVIEYQTLKSVDENCYFESTIIYPGEREKNDCFHKIVFHSESPNCTVVESWFHNHHKDKSSNGIVGSCTEILLGVHRSMQSHLLQYLSMEPRHETEMTLYSSSPNFIETINKELPKPPERKATRKVKSVKAIDGDSKNASKKAHKPSMFKYLVLKTLKAKPDKVAQILEAPLPKVEHKEFGECVGENAKVFERQAYVYNFPSQESNQDYGAELTETQTNELIAKEVIHRFKSYKSQKDSTEQSFKDNLGSEPITQDTPKDIIVIKKDSFESEKGLEYPPVHLPSSFTIHTDCNCACSSHHYVGVSGLTILYFLSFTCLISYFVGIRVLSTTIRHLRTLVLFMIHYVPIEEITV